MVANEDNSAYVYNYLLQVHESTFVKSKYILLEIVPMKQRKEGEALWTAHYHDYAPQKRKTELQKHLSVILKRYVQFRNEVFVKWADVDQ